MKRNNLIIVMLLVLAGLFTMQSCTKVDDTTFTGYGAFIEPVPASPLDGELISISGSTLDLSWTTSDVDGDTPKADVYFSEDADPALLVKDHNANSITVDVVQGHTYYWRVVLWDANGIQTKGATYSFTVSVNYNVTDYSGAYSCLEPGYGSYAVNLTKIDENTIETDNFWDSGWAVQYVFDHYGKVTIIPITISGYHIVSLDGGFNNADQSWWVHYKVTNATTGATVDENTHTFTRP